jgi:hypothetical protein
MVRPRGNTNESEAALLLLLAYSAGATLAQDQGTVKGKDAFDKAIENNAFTGNPTIKITRMTELALVPVE